jgi:nitroreductase
VDLYDVMRHTPATREYLPEDVPDGVLYRVLDHARFAPSGGNRQGWRVVVIRDAGVKARLNQLYLPIWDDYVARRWGPVDEMDTGRRQAFEDADSFVRALAAVPVWLAVWLRLAAVEVADADTGHPSVVAGGSVFPFVHNIQLACRAEGLGSRITTLLSARERDVAGVLGVPEGYALAAVVVVGRPVRLRDRLRRRPVEQFATRDRFDGEPFTK